MTKHDYKAALKCFDEGFEGDPDFLKFAHGEAIRHALKVADKLMQEPSEGIFEAGWNAFGEVDKKWISMRDQMLKEVE